MDENIVFHKSNLETQLAKAKELYFENIIFGGDRSSRCIYKIMRLERELQLLTEFLGKEALNVFAVVAEIKKGA